MINPLWITDIHTRVHGKVARSCFIDSYLVLDQSVSQTHELTNIFIHKNHTSLHHIIKFVNFHLYN